MKVDNWERTKIKWNRHKKELMEIIEDGEELMKHDESESEGQKHIL